MGFFASLEKNLPVFLGQTAERFGDFGQDGLAIAGDFAQEVGCVVVDSWEAGLWGDDSALAVAQASIQSLLKANQKARHRTLAVAKGHFRGQAQDYVQYMKAMGGGMADSLHDVGEATGVGGYGLLQFVNKVLISDDLGVQISRMGPVGMLVGGWYLGGFAKLNQDLKQQVIPAFQSGSAPTAEALAASKEEASIKLATWTFSTALSGGLGAGVASVTGSLSKGPAARFLLSKSGQWGTQLAEALLSTAASQSFEAQAKGLAGPNLKFWEWSRQEWASNLLVFGMATLGATLGAKASGGRAPTAAPESPLGGPRLQAGADGHSGPINLSFDWGDAYPSTRPSASPPGTSKNKPPSPPANPLAPRRLHPHLAIVGQGERQYLQQVGGKYYLFLDGAPNPLQPRASGPQGAPRVMIDAQGQAIAHGPGVQINYGGHVLDLPEGQGMSLLVAKEIIIDGRPIKVVRTGGVLIDYPDLEMIRLPQARHNTLHLKPGAEELILGSRLRDPGSPFFLPHHLAYGQGTVCLFKQNNQWLVKPLDARPIWLVPAENSRGRWIYGPTRLAPGDTLFIPDIGHPTKGSPQQGEWIQLEALP